MGWAAHTKVMEQMKTSDNILSPRYKYRLQIQSIRGLLEWLSIFQHDNLARKAVSLW